MVKELEVRGKIFLLLKRIFFSIFTLCVGENTLTPSEAETTLHNWKILIVKDSVKIQRLAEVNEKKCLATFVAFFKNKVESCKIQYKG